jgi:hypothetical protein
MTISTLMMSMLLLLVLCLGSVAIVSILVIYQLQIRLMRIFSEQQGVSVESMENKTAVPEPIVPKVKKRMFSMPIPGAEFLRSGKK